MVPSVYIESSVISYLTARPSRDVVTAARQAITEEWWRERLDSFEIFISALVEEEISSGNADAAKRRLEAVEDFSSLDITDKAQKLAESLLAARAIPTTCPRRCVAYRDCCCKRH